MPISPHYTPAPRFLALGEGFADPVRAARFPAEIERFYNHRWAARIGLGELTPDERARHFWGFEPLPGNLPEPLALRYHGHQFGIYNPGLGDGRGFLFAQLVDPQDGRLLDLGTKGSGTTPYSRGGDGRLTLKGGVREVLATEMLEALGVPTSRSFSLFETGDRLFRGDEPSPTRSSVLVRLSHSHVRFGTFQRLAYSGEKDRLSAMLDFAVTHLVPEARGEGGDDVVRFVRAVAVRSARLAAAWMVAGFSHGVLNTDNMNVTGESFDYGPYRFVPEYDPDFVAAYFDEVGLYAFGKQPRVVLWNVTRLADALRPLSPSSPLGEALRAFEPAFFEALAGRMRHRLGLASAGHDLDEALADAVIAFLEESRAPLDRFFFDWFGGPASEPRAMASPLRSHYEGERGAALRKLLELFEPASKRAPSHPYFARAAPVTLLIDEIEAVWSAIAERDDWSLFEAKIQEIRLLGDALGVDPGAGT
jgi:uncharacterized protein YdiU (UPF0061 family)